MLDKKSVAGSALMRKTYGAEYPHTLLGKGRGVARRMRVCSPSALVGQNGLIAEETL